VRVQKVRLPISRKDGIKVQGTIAVLQASKTHVQGFPGFFDDIQPYQSPAPTCAALRRLTGGRCGYEVHSDAPTSAPAADSLLETRV
jgi:hypothetical protein